MADLLSIAPLTEMVLVRGASESSAGIAARVTGVTAQGIAHLLFRFPDLRKMMGTGSWDISRLLDLSDEILSAIIAAGVEGLDEANAGNLALGEKAELLGAVIRVTMPRGPVPFMETLTSLMAGVGNAASAEAPATKSPKRSKNSDARAATPTHGTTPHASSPDG